MKTEHLQEFLKPPAGVFRERTGLSLSLGRPAYEDAGRSRLDLSVVTMIEGNLHGAVVTSYEAGTALEVARVALDRPELAADDPVIESILAEMGAVAVGRSLDVLERLGLEGTMVRPSVVAGDGWTSGAQIPSVVFECQTPVGKVALAFALAVEDAAAHERRAQGVTIVDHSVFSRRQLVQVVQKTCFRVDLAAKDGPSALAAYEKKPSAFVLVDLLELGMNEIQFVEKLLEVNPRAMVAIVSSAKPKQILEELATRGVVDVFSKPVDEKVLAARLREATVHRLGVDIEEGGLAAFLTVEPARIERRAPRVEDLEQALLRRGVVEGVDRAVLQQILDRPMFGERVEVARGAMPERGQPAQVELYFDDRVQFGHLMKEEGAAGNIYDSVRLIRRVEPGKPLVQKFAEPTVGAEGRLVTGRQSPGLPGWDPVREGPGLEVTDAGRMLLAAEKGAARLDGEHLHLEPLLEIQRSVTRATGDINFHGSVLIWGDVSGGATVTATGDVEVKGDVEGGQIRAGRDVLVGRVIGKKGTGSVYSLGNVGCRYVQAATIGCFGDLYVLGFANQVELTVGGSLTLLGEQPNYSGGKAFVGEVVDIGDLGSHRAHETLLEIASETFHDRLDDVLSVLRSAFKENPPIGVRKQIQADAAFCERIDAKRQELRELREVLRVVWKKGEAENHAKVRGSAYPGSLIRIGSRFIDLEKRQTSVRFFLRGMSVGISEFSKMKQ